MAKTTCMPQPFEKNVQYYKFGLYGFFKNLRFFDAFLILFFLEKGLSFLEIGFLYSAREIAIIMLEVPSGVVADALGRRRTLISSFMVYIISFIVFSFSNSFGLLMIGMLCYAYADAFRTGVHKAMIFHYLKENNWSEHKVAYYGHTRSWSQFGSAVSSIGAGLIVFYSGNYELIFLISVVPYLLDMILVYSYPKYLDGRLQQFSSLSVRENFRQVIQALVNTLKQKELLLAVNSLSLYSGFYSSIKDYIQPLLKSFALSIPLFAALSDDKRTALWIGFFYFFIYMITAWVSRNSGRFNARFAQALKPMNLTIIIGFMVGIFTGLGFLLGYYVFAIIGFLIILVIENLRKPIGISVIANLTQEKAMSSVLSVSSQAKSIFAAMLAPVIGFLADLLNPGTAMAIVSVFLILIMPVYYLRSRASAIKNERH